MEIIISTEVKEELDRHAEDVYPEECCGFLYGTEEGDQRQLTDISEVDNQREGNRKRRFEVSTEDYMNAEKYAANNNLKLLGVYHSHPDHNPYPSEHDREMAMPYFSYVIVSVKEGKADETASWQLNDERQFEEETVRIESLSTTKK